jgi:hypothetical protein
VLPSLLWATGSQREQPRLPPSPQLVHGVRLALASKLSDEVDKPHCQRRCGLRRSQVEAPRQRERRLRKNRIKHVELTAPREKLPDGLFDAARYVQPWRLLLEARDEPTDMPLGDAELSCEIRRAVAPSTHASCSASTSESVNLRFTEMSECPSFAAARETVTARGCPFARPLQ